MNIWDFYKVNCSANIGFSGISLFGKMFELLTCKKKIMSLRRHVENVFYLKDFVTWQVCEVLSDVSQGGVFTLLFATTTLGCHAL